MHTSAFFKLFPPPKFMVMKYAGLDISDEGIHCLEYKSSVAGMRISKYAHAEVPGGIIDGGDIKDEMKLAALLADFDKKYDLSYVKVSLPEEKVYLFQTDVPDADGKAIEQNIESKLEENVPLAAPDAVFYFDLLPMSVTGGTTRASVSVVPRTYIEHYIEVLHSSGIFPVAFEVIPKSIARAVVPQGTDRTHIIIHIMKKKTGIYVVSGGVVCFTSTVTTGTASSEANGDYASVLSKEINRVYSYWMSHSAVQSPVETVILTGDKAPAYETALQNVVAGVTLPVRTADVWGNAFNLDHYVPPISRDDSLEYVVAAGLAMDMK